MRKMYALFIIASFWMACNPQPKKDQGGSTLGTSAASEASAADMEDWPYQPTKRPDWEPGDITNVPIAMNVIKSYEVKDFVTIKNYLADTVEFLSSRGNFKGTRNEMANYLKRLRDERLDVKIEMNDYSSVTSKKRKENWVSLWYTEKITDKAGVTDSSLSMDEYKIVNGKVALIDTKSRRLGRK